MSVGSFWLPVVPIPSCPEPLNPKQASASVLEPYAGKSAHGNHGQRVVAGQRLMQAASDLFLGWTRGKGGRESYIRQLCDNKVSPVIESWDARALRLYGRLCAHALAYANTATKPMASAQSRLLREITESSFVWWVAEDAASRGARRSP